MVQHLLLSQHARILVLQLTLQLLHLRPLLRGMGFAVRFELFERVLPRLLLRWLSRHKRLPKKRQLPDWRHNRIKWWWQRRRLRSRTINEWPVPKFPSIDGRNIPAARDGRQGPAASEPLITKTFLKSLMSGVDSAPLFFGLAADLVDSK